MARILGTKKNKKMINIKKEHIILFLSVFFLFIPDLYAINPGNSSKPQFVDVQTSIKAFEDGWKGLANIVIGMAMLIGIVSVVKALAMKQEDAKKLLYSWLIALIVWQVAFAIF